MKFLMVTKLAMSSRAVSTIARYCEIGRHLGHEVAVFGERQPELPFEFSLDVKSFDFAIFVVYMPFDFPDLPYLAAVLDGMPKERRIVVDCVGRYNETYRVEHDFNHLEKMEGHQGWEWVEALQTVAGLVVQPTLSPRREDVRSFLFHAYDTRAVTRPYRSPAEAAGSWAGTNGSSRPYGLVYVGNNWQRWSQMRRLLEGLEPIRGAVGRICIAGWDWSKRPDWAVQLGIQGVDVDTDLLARLAVETQDAIPFTEVVPFLGKARFAPVVHRPLFNHLGLVTNRTFETFAADTLPLLLIPEDFAEAIYGLDARPLVVGDDVAGTLRDMMRHPEVYWDAVLRVREYLAAHHSYEQRFSELIDILDGGESASRQRRSGVAHR
jgi:hypothetical protein